MKRFLMGTGDSMHLITAPNQRAARTAYRTTLGHDPTREREVELARISQVRVSRGLNEGRGSVALEVQREYPVESAEIAEELYDKVGDYVLISTGNVGMVDGYFDVLNLTSRIHYREQEDLHLPTEVREKVQSV